MPARFATPDANLRKNEEPQAVFRFLTFWKSQLVERDVEIAVKMMLDHMVECLAGGPAERTTD